MKPLPLTVSRGKLVVPASSLTYRNNIRSPSLVGETVLPGPGRVLLFTLSRPQFLSGLPEITMAWSGVSWFDHVSLVYDVDRNAIILGRPPGITWPDPLTAYVLTSTPHERLLAARDGLRPICLNLEDTKDRINRLKSSMKPHSLIGEVHETDYTLTAVVVCME